jgi:hypothetical protein
VLYFAECFLSGHSVKYIFTECPDKKHSAKSQTLGKVSVSSSEGGGVDSGADVVGLEDSPVDEHEEADGEEEPAEAFSTAAALVPPVAATLFAGHGGQKTLLPPLWLVNGGREDGGDGRSVCVCFGAAMLVN